METRVIYSAAAGSLDSWDMENLKYLRKISQCHTGPNDMETIYNSDNDNHSVTNGEDVLETPLPAPMEIFNTINRKISTSSCGSSLSVSGSNKTVIPAAPHLEDCYLLDVVTVRNESVLAVCNPNPKLSTSMHGVHGSGGSSRKIKLSDGSDSSSSASSVSSFGGSPTEEVNFFDGMDHDEYSDCSRSGTCSSTRSTSMSTIVKGESPLRKTQVRNGCPFCCESPTNSYYYLGQSGHLDSSSLVPTVGGEPPPSTPRSPSPYYVRLRRDLIPSFTPPLNQPRNFGMNKQGQLVIDYSPNWDGLETYVKNLSLYN